MVVFVVRTKLTDTQHKHKLDHHLLHRQKSPEFKPSGSSDKDRLRAFRSRTSDALNDLMVMTLLLPDSSNATTIMMISFAWLDRGFDLLRATNASFVSLIEEDLGYPMSEWAGPLADAYFSYTLDLLDGLNSISSALGQLRTSRLALAHALVRFKAGSAAAAAAYTLKTIDCQPREWKNFTVEEGGVSGFGSDFPGKEGIALEAVGDARGIALWVCGVALSGLGGEVNKCMEQRKLAASKSKWWMDRERMGQEVLVVLREVKEVNEAVAGVAGQRGDEELGDVKREVEGFGEMLAAAENKLGCLFTEVMASRNRLLDCLRGQTKEQ